MSLSLSRRIAKAALLTAAGAATVLGASGSASAAALPSLPVGGLSPEEVNQSLNGLTHETSHTLGNLNDHTMGATVPAAGQAVGQAGKKGPLGGAGNLLHSLPLSSLPVGATDQNGQLPLVGQLPGPLGG